MTLKYRAGGGLRFALSDAPAMATRRRNTEEAVRYRALRTSLALAARWKQFRRSRKWCWCSWTVIDDSSNPKGKRRRHRKYRRLRAPSRQTMSACRPQMQGAACTGCGHLKRTPRMSGPPWPWWCGTASQFRANYPFANPSTGSHCRHIEQGLVQVPRGPPAGGVARCYRSGVILPS